MCKKRKQSGKVTHNSQHTTVTVPKKLKLEGMWDVGLNKNFDENNK